LHPLPTQRLLIRALPALRDVGASSAGVATDFPEILNAFRNHFGSVSRDLLTHAGVAEIRNQLTNTTAQIVNDLIEIDWAIILDEFIDRLAYGAMTAIVVIMCFTHGAFSVPPGWWRRPDR
jgi:hypothetical protein